MYIARYKLMTTDFQKKITTNIVRIIRFEFIYKTTLYARIKTCLLTSRQMEHCDGMEVVFFSC